MSVVFLCIGAAKAGTTWLHRQLSGHPGCYFRAIKELHYFDAIDGNRLSEELQKHRDEQEALLTRLAERGALPGETQALRLADRAEWMDVLERGREDTGAYLAYLRNGAASGQVVGEMTPAYALLSQDRLSAMAKMGSDVRFLFLLRDPVERLWSHVRMIAVRRDPNGKVSARRCANILERTLSGRETEIVRRSDYAGMLARLIAAVPARARLVEVFEEMIAGAGLDRICAFLGISAVAPSPRAVHEGQFIEMTGEQRRAAARWLAPQYEAAERALGRMPGAWQPEG